MNELEQIREMVWSCCRGCQGSFAASVDETQLARHQKSVRAALSGADRLFWLRSKIAQRLVGAKFSQISLASGRARLSQHRPNKCRMSPHSHRGE